MTIVRSLTTLLNFKIDDKQLIKFNNTIIGVKSKLLSYYTTLAFVASKVKDTINKFTEGILESNDLSKSLDIPLKKLKAIEIVLSEIRIGSKEFEQIFRSVNKLTTEAVSGRGALLREQNSLRIKDSIRKDDGSIKDDLDVFFIILDALRLIQDPRAQRAKANELLGSEKIIDLLVLSNAEIKKKIALEEENAVVFEKAVAPLEKFNLELIKLGNTLKYLMVSVITPFLEGVNKGIERIKSGNSPEILVRQFNKRTGGIGQKIKDFISSPFTSLSGTQNKATPQIQVTNNIDMSIPEGTSDQQAQFIESKVEQAMEESIYNNWFKIGRNFPITE